MENIIQSKVYELDNKISKLNHKLSGLNEQKDLLFKQLKDFEENRIEISTDIQKILDELNKKDSIYVIMLEDGDVNEFHILGWTDDLDTAKKVANKLSLERSLNIYGRVDYYKVDNIFDTELTYHFF